MCSLSVSAMVNEIEMKNERRAPFSLSLQLFVCPINLLWLTWSPPPRTAHRHEPHMLLRGTISSPKKKGYGKEGLFAHLHRTHHSSDRAMDSEHESEDEFNTNNDDTRTEDGSDRGEPEEGV